MKNHQFDITLQDAAKMLITLASIIALVVALGAFAGAL